VFTTAEGRGDPDGGSYSGPQEETPPKRGAFFILLVKKDRENCYFGISTIARM